MVQHARRLDVPLPWTLLMVVFGASIGAVGVVDWDWHLPGPSWGDGTSTSASMASLERELNLLGNVAESACSAPDAAAVRSLLEDAQRLIVAGELGRADAKAIEGHDTLQQQC